MVDYCLRRSKLEIYVDILKVLAYNGPLKVTHILYKANVNCSILNVFVADLIKCGLVEERIDRRKGTVFAITQNGVTTLKYFNELNQILPIVEETKSQVPIPY
jgi:predicted transcriptional regulator